MTDTTATRVLIGHTGFVGANLAAQAPFDLTFNSANFRDMTGRHFGHVTCAGVQAVKWWANQNPEEDRARIAALEAVLSTVTADAFTLISTVDVYPDPRGVDEGDVPPAEGAPYGRHRREFELFVAARFAGATIVRLPGLFGRGLKKNLVFDVLAGKDLSGFDARSTFQFYHLDRLAKDIAVARAAGLGTINLAVEPVSVATVVEAMTGRAWTHRTERPPVAYDMRTRHADLWGRTGPYVEGADETLSRIAAFAADWRATATAAPAERAP